VAFEEEKDNGTLLTLNRGLQVLEGVARQEGTSTAKGLSDEVGIKIGTCYQILRTLQASGYVERLPGGRYGLGARVAFLSGHFESNTAPPTALLAVLRDLHATLDESVYISLRQGSKVVIAATMEGTRAVRVGPLHVGYSDHPHARATTKCFLAYTDPRELHSYVNPDSLERLTHATITSWTDLLEDFRVTRERGYGMDIEEFTEGVGCISSIILNGDAVAVGAFGISMPIGRLDLRRDQAIAAAKHAGRCASEALGYQGPYPPLNSQKTQRKQRVAQ
jgi:IclR family acetate operon transcriptional repressor